MKPRPRHLVTLLLLPLVGALATPSPATATPEAPPRGTYIEEVSASFADDGDLTLDQDTRTSRRVRLLSHDYALDVRGGPRPEYVVLYGRGASRPEIYTARRFEKVRCIRATGESLPGGRSTVEVPGRCLREDGVKPRTVTVRPSVLVQLRRPGGDTCDTQVGPRLGPLARGESEGAGSAGSPPRLAARGCRAG